MEFAPFCFFYHPPHHYDDNCVGSLHCFFRGNPLRKWWVVLFFLILLLVLLLLRMCLVDAAVAELIIWSDYDACVCSLLMSCFLFLSLSLSPSFVSYLSSPMPFLHMCPCIHTWALVISGRVLGFYGGCCRGGVVIGG